MNIIRNINNGLRTAFLTIPLLGCGAAFLLTGCQDDHFDIAATQLTGDKTIWQNIQSHPELSQFADILQNVKYSQNEFNVTEETYADIFDGDQTFTVWAPVNDKFNYDYYKKLIATGIRDSIYKVETELIRNHMTRFSTVMTANKDSVKMSLFNNKYAWLNYDKQTIKGVKITESNIGSTNGVLHITDAPVAYQPNLYEFLATRPEFDSINTFIKSYEKIDTNWVASTPGPTINGIATWVDIITYKNNDYLSYNMRANLEREDSNYAVIVPTNEAWKNILEKGKKYYRYKTTPYKHITYLESGRWSDYKSNDIITLSKTQPDSLQDKLAKENICNNLAFNANWQYERIPITSLSNLREADIRLDSLRSTAGTKFKKTGTLNRTNSISSTVEIDSYVDMFGNKEPEELSNGYAYTINEYTFPHTFFAPDYDMPAFTCYDAYKFDTGTINPVFPWTKQDHQEITEPVIDEETGEPVIDEETGEPLTTVVASRDSIYRYNYVVITPTSQTTKPEIWFRLENVRSCKYDIYVVIGYNDAANAPNVFTAGINYNTDTGYKEDQPLYNPDENAVIPDRNGADYNTATNRIYFSNKVPEPDENLVMNYTDTICVAKDFEFPVAYAGLGGLESMTGQNLFPQLHIKCDAKATDVVRGLYTNQLRINAVILRSKEW